MFKLSVGDARSTLDCTTDQQREGCKPVKDWQVSGHDAQAMINTLIEEGGSSYTVTQCSYRPTCLH